MNLNSVINWGDDGGASEMHLQWLMWFIRNIMACVVYLQTVWLLIFTNKIHVFTWRKNMTLQYFYLFGSFSLSLLVNWLGRTVVFNSMTQSDHIKGFCHSVTLELFNVSKRTAITGHKNKRVSFPVEYLFPDSKEEKHSLCLPYKMKKYRTDR